MNAETRTTTAGVSIVPNGSELKVTTPYHPEFVAFARSRNGKWIAPVWIFDARDESSVRAKCRKVYGTDGASVPCVDVRVSEKYNGWENPSFALGRELCRRRSRDEGVRLGEKVVVISGGFPSCGGSVKNPGLQARDNTVLEVRDVPADLAAKFAAKYQGITIVSQVPSPRETAIMTIKAMMTEHGIEISELT